MTTRLIFFLMLSCAVVYANILMTPEKAMRHAFGLPSAVTKDDILLTETQADAAAKQAQLKLETKIYTVYRATLHGKTIGYGILIIRNVREKDAAILYMITPEGTIKSIGIIAFDEAEYMPSQAYLKRFEGKSEIHSGGPASMPGKRNVTDGARLALALFNTVIRPKLGTCE